MSPVSTRGNSSSPSTPLDIARDALRRGFRPLPVPYGSKAPTIPGWQRLRVRKRTLAQHFNGHEQNVGILLGKPSAGAVDIDLDCREALRLAPIFLPATSARYGRPSKPVSHW